MDITTLATARSYVDQKAEELNTRISNVVISGGGYVPIKGTDYWTNADKEEIIEDVLESQDVQDLLDSAPTASVTQTSSGATITITDKNGTTTANIQNGSGGSGLESINEYIEKQITYLDSFSYSNNTKAIATSQTFIVPENKEHRNFKITGFLANITQAGNLTIGTVMKTKQASTATSYVAHETVTVTNTGVQVVKLTNPLYLTSDRLLTITTTSAKFRYGSFGNQIGFYMTPYTAIANYSLGISVFGEDVNDNANYERLDLPISFRYKNYIINQDGMIASTTPSTIYSCYVDRYYVNQGQKYYITGSSLNPYSIYGFYDSNDILIGDTYPVTTDKGENNTVNYLYRHEVIVPNGAATLRVAGILNILQPKVERKSTKNINSKKFEGKVWCAIGDSFTDINETSQVFYHQYISTETGIDVINLGKLGCGYKAGGYPFSTRTWPADLANVDVITLFGSGNDMNKGYTLGSPTDTGTTTLCGCINTTIDNIKSVAPDVPFGIITPAPFLNYPLSNPTNEMALYTNALIEICNIRGIPCLDLYHTSGLKPWEQGDVDKYYKHDTTNRIHPDEDGHRLIANKIEPFVKDVLSGGTLYIPDGIGKVKAQIAEAEESTAVQNHSIDDLIIVNNELRKITNTIAQGEQITSNNSLVTTIGDELASINTILHKLLPSPTAGAHNGIYREKDITQYFTDGSLWSRINGTDGYSLFEDIYLGDYIVINSVSYTVVDFDYYLHRCGGTDFNQHHLVMMPTQVMTIPQGTVLYNPNTSAEVETLSFINNTNASTTVTSQENATSFKWNSTMENPNTGSTNGGYKFSRIRTVTMRAADTIVINAFGTDHVKSIVVQYPNPADASTAGQGASWEWFTSTDWTNPLRKSICDLPSETQVYGCSIWARGTLSNNNMGYEVGAEQDKFAIYDFQRSFRHTRISKWLRSVVSGTAAAAIQSYGNAIAGGASAAYGVQPRFLIG